MNDLETSNNLTVFHDIWGPRSLKTKVTLSSEPVNNQ